MNSTSTVNRDDNITRRDFLAQSTCATAAIGNYEWVGGAAYVADCLLTGQPSLITPEHGLHVLDVMNACHESQRTGRRAKCETTFPWPIIKEA